MCGSRIINVFQAGAFTKHSLHRLGESSKLSPRPPLCVLLSIGAEESLKGCRTAGKGFRTLIVRKALLNKRVRHAVV